MQNALDRRSLILIGLSAAGGLAIGLPLPAESATAKLKSRSKAVSLQDGQNGHGELGAWLIIDPDSTVTVRIPHQEMGQGTATALAMLVAEELECEWASVRIEYVSAIAIGARAASFTVQ